MADGRIHGWLLCMRQMGWCSKLMTWQLSWSLALLEELLAGQLLGRCSCFCSALLVAYRLSRWIDKVKSGHLNSFIFSVCSNGGSDSAWGYWPQHRPIRCYHSNSQVEGSCFLTSQRCSWIKTLVKSFVQRLNIWYLLGADAASGVSRSNHFACISS